MKKIQDKFNLTDQLIAAFLNALSEGLRPDESKQEEKTEPKNPMDVGDNLFIKGDKCNGVGAK